MVNYSKRTSFQIIAKALVLTLKNNNPLEVYPGILQPVSMKDLEAVTNDVHQWRPILITLQTKPQNGKLVWTGNATGEVLSFTQEDINAGRIGYQHNAPMGSWSSEDSFTFDVSTAYAESLNFQAFKVLISYENINDDNKGQLILTSPVEVEEGGSVTIERTDLDLSMLRRRLANSGLRNPEVHYVVTDPPHSGVLMINGDNATKETTFMQKDINKGRVQYIHDDSDTKWDAFMFNIEIEVTGSVSEDSNKRSSRLSNVFNITVKPVNDQPFKLQTDSPEIRLVQGFTAVITQKELHTIDPDTPPEGIIYHIMNGPDNGIIVLARNPDNAIRTFTQKDIDDGEVIFVQDGSMESGAFYFHVSDGTFKPYYKVFNIHVNPLTLEIRNTSSIRLLQGHSSVFLSSENIQVETNGRRDKIMYNVTRPPNFGQLYMHDHPVHLFRQHNIDNREITYIQTDMSSGTDFFEFIVYDSRNVIGTDQLQRINITVDPRVKQKPLNARPGGNVVFTTEVLDAGDLASSSGSDPTYTILAGPKLGHLYRVSGRDDGERQKREAARKRKKGRGRQPENGGGDGDGEVEVSSFTHQDILARKIVYRPNPSNATHDRTDSFTYKLTAANSQPATNTYYIRVKGVIPPEKKVDSTPVPANPTPVPVKPSDAPAGEAGATETAPAGTTKASASAYSNDRLVVIILVSAITVLVVIGLVIMRCLKMRRKRREKLEKAKEDSRTPLAQPHVHIEPQKLNMATYHDDPDAAERMRGDDRGGHVPVINITPDTPQMFEHHHGRHSPPMGRHRSRSRSPSSAATSRSNHSLPRPKSPNQDRSRSGSPPHTSTYRRQGPIPVATPTVPAPPAPPQSSAAAAAAAAAAHGAQQLQTEAEVSRTVPTCKVTPLFDGDGVEVHSPSGTLKRDQVTFDWENVDPELLQHCRTTNPVLHENKYWV